MSTYSNDIGREEEDGAGWGHLVPSKEERQATLPEHHTEMLSPPLAWGPEAYRDRHLTSEDGETYLADPRCPRCVWLWANLKPTVEAKIGKMEAK